MANDIYGNSYNNNTYSAQYQVQHDTPTGAAVPEEADFGEHTAGADVETEEYIFCPHCNERLKHDAVFCPFCGTKLSGPVFDDEYEPTIRAD